MPTGGFEREEYDNTSENFNGRGADGSGDRVGFRQFNHGNVYRW